MSFVLYTGDGTVISASGLSATYEYPEFGIYYPSATSAGELYTASAVTINPLPEISATGMFIINEPIIFQISNYSDFYYSTISAVYWNFGDGAVSAGTLSGSIIHEYTKALDKQVIVSAYDISANVGIGTYSVTLGVCEAKEDYITICGLDREYLRFGMNKYIDLVQYLPDYLKDCDVEIFLKFFQDFLNTMFYGVNGYVTSAVDLTITKDVPSDNDKYYTYVNSEGTSVSASTSADDAQELVYTTSSDSVLDNVEIAMLEGETLTKRISILEKVKRITELQDPDLIDLEYIQYFAKNLGYDVNVTREQIGTNLGDLANSAAADVSGVCENDDRDRYLRFVVSNLPSWYKIKTTRNSVKVMLYSFGLIGDLIEYYSNDYNNNWIADRQKNLTDSNIPNDYYPTPHFAVQIDIDQSLGSISFDWERRNKVINAIESLRPINTVFRELSGYLLRTITLWTAINVRVRKNIVITGW